MARPEQGELIDTSHPGHKVLKTAAKKYRNARDERMAAMKPEKEAKDKLIDLMHEHKLEKFTLDGLVIELLPGKTKVRVRDENEDDDADEIAEDDKE